MGQSAWNIFLTNMYKTCMPHAKYMEIPTKQIDQHFFLYNPYIDKM